MRLPRALLAASLALALTGPLTVTSADAAPARQIDYQQWGSAKQLRAGKLAGLRVARGQLRIAHPVGTRRHANADGSGSTRYAFGRWTSPWAAPGFGLTELIPSWSATTRGDSWLQVQVRGRSEDGQRSSWDSIANWAPGDDVIRRTSLGEQPDDLGRVAVDTWKSNFAVEFTSWQIRLTLFRRAGTRDTPFVEAIGAVASNLPQVGHVRRSRPGAARGITLDVPEYSQMTHRGHYLEYGNGGEAWCSPTSTTMVLGYYDALPTEEEYAWVDGSYRDRYVDHAARMTYDHRYQGTGNWPFNTAYAATHTGHGFVTRLRNLRQVERFIKAGIPVVTSIAFGPGELDGAPISATDGHLVVVVGFTETGDVVVNDPAARHNRGVRRTYDRGQFENAWLPTSGGLSYIIHTADQKLPARKGADNW